MLTLSISKRTKVADGTKALRPIRIPVLHLVPLINRALSAITTQLIPRATLTGVLASRHHQIELTIRYGITPTKASTSSRSRPILELLMIAIPTARNLAVVWALSPQSTSFHLALSCSISSACSLEPGDGGPVSSRPTAPSSLASSNSLSSLFPLPCSSLIMLRCVLGRWLRQRATCSGLWQMTGRILLPLGLHNGFGCLFGCA